MLGGWLGIPLQILASFRQQIESWFILKVRMKVIALVSMIWVFGESEGLLQYYADHYLADAILRSTATILSVLSHPLQFAGSAIVSFRPRLGLALAAAILFILLTPHPLVRAAEQWVSFDMSSHEMVDTKSMPLHQSFFNEQTFGARRRSMRIVGEAI